MSSIIADSPNINDNVMDAVDETCSTADTEEAEGQQAELEIELELDPPLLQPDPSQMSSCLRAPCLKRNAASEAVGTSSLSGSGTSSPLLSSSPPSSIPVYSFSGIKVLCSAVPKRQVHFDAAPPEAGLTHSGESYDRRPIECTQGGSQMDLRLPPRGTCSRYSDDADDEACEDEEEDEESKKERLQGFARWARLKNGGSMLGGATGVKFSGTSSGRRNSEENLESTNVCSVPVHGIRSFGGLAGKSSLTSADNEEDEDDDDRSEGKALSDIAYNGSDADTRRSVDNDEDSESEDRQEAFRKAVYAALSKDPNATPMPSPSVRPRWECVTSYFDPSSEADATKEEVLDLSVQPAKSVSSESSTQLSLCSPTLTPLSKEQEECKVTTWTQDQADNKHDDLPLTFKTDFSLNLPAPKASPSSSFPVEGSGSSINHPFSSPMSSRCSSSDAWSSGCGGGIWSGSEQDAFEAAFSKDAAQTTAIATAIPTQPMLSLEPNLKSLTSPSSTDTKEMLPPVLPIEASHDSKESEIYHQEQESEQVTSSSSSGGGPGWLSSCCTSPEISAVDVAEQRSISGMMDKAFTENTLTVKAALLQQLAPLDLQRNISTDGSSVQSHDTISSGSSIRQGQLFDRNGIVSSPTSGNCSPRVLSGDEEDVTSPSCRSKSSNLFRCSSKKSRKARRTVSGNVREESSPDDPSRPIMTPRSKSMSSAAAASTTTCGIKRANLIKKTSAFNSNFDDEGALGGF